MKTSIFCCLAGLALVLTACSDDSEPVVPEKAPVALPLSITASGDYTETYAYDRNGRVRQWHVTDGPDEVLCTYEYPAANSINVTTAYKTYNVGISGERRYTDNILLDANGRALSCDGVMRIYSGSELDGEFIYTYRFIYNIAGQLVNIERAQWRRNDDTPMRWTDEIEWHDGNPTRYVDYAGHATPYYTTSYTYFPDSESETYKPVMIPKLGQFAPLQRCGVFGKLPKDLLMKAETENHVNHTTTTERYSYNFALTDEGSRISSYTLTSSPTRAVTYLLTWDI